MKNILWHIVICIVMLASVLAAMLFRIQALEQRVAELEKAPYILIPKKEKRK